MSDKLTAGQLRDIADAMERGGRDWHCGDRTVAELRKEADAREAKSALCGCGEVLPCPYHVKVKPAPDLPTREDWERVERAYGRPSWAHDDRAKIISNAARRLASGEDVIVPAKHGEECFYSSTAKARDERDAALAQMETLKNDRDRAAARADHYQHRAAVAERDLELVDPSKPWKTRLGKWYSDAAYDLRVSERDQAYALRDAALARVSALEKELAEAREHVENIVEHWNGRCMASGRRSCQAPAIAGRWLARTAPGSKP